MSGGIIRVKRKESEYFMALNAPFNDSSLSFGARGILAYLLSKPDDWLVSNEDLYRQSPASRTAIDRMIRELKDGGYIRRYQEPNHKGHRVWVTEVYEDRNENPDFSGSDDEMNGHYPKVQNPTVGKPERRKTRQSVNQQAENPTVGKPDDILITDTNKGLNRQITDNTNPTTTTRTHASDYDDGSDLDFGPIDEGFASISKAYQNEIGALSPMISDGIKAELDHIRQILAEQPQGDETAEEWILYAIEQAVSSNARRWDYTRGVIKGVKRSKSLAAHKLNGSRKDNSNGQRSTNSGKRRITPQTRQVKNDPYKDNGQRVSSAGLPIDPELLARSRQQQARPN